MPQATKPALRPRSRRAQGSNSKERPVAQARTPVIGLESEFTVYVQEEKCLPEHIFRSPQQIVREKMIPRTGRSFHLPSGGALYFDTGVIEVATPIIEIEEGCCVRAARSLWEQIEFLRGELDAWEQQHGKTVRLEGFSSHYNVSIPDEYQLDQAGMHRLALLLTHLLHPPVMLLAANRLSTGVGVRPRDHRIEITVDFTPDPWLMVATTTLIVGITLAVLRWPDHSLAELERRGFPVIQGFKPRKHTSRKGYLARFDCFPRNPFASDPNKAEWLVNDGRMLSLRNIASEIARPFRKAMRELGDADVVRHIYAVLDGKARSLLDFAARPRRYEDVGRIIDWNRRAMRDMPRSKYEQVIQRIITHRPIQVGTTSYRPERMRGWYEVVFRNTRNGHRRVFNLDDLVRHCAVD
ncbi:hypothetical protein ACXR0O_26010 [Verrucomicrobiota bacterium sgz303538]